VKDFNPLRALLFHKDESLKTAAQEEFLKYIDKVMSANYGSDLYVLHKCQKESNSTDLFAKDVIQEKKPQVIRDA